MKIFLDDERQTPKGYVRCYWPQEVIWLLKNNKVTHVSLDHDLGDDQRGTGYDVLKWIEEQVFTVNNYYPPNLNIHSANPAARKRMQEAIDSIKKRVSDKTEEKNKKRINEQQTHG